MLGFAVKQVLWKQ